MIFINDINEVFKKKTIQNMKRKIEKCFIPSWEKEILLKMTFDHRFTKPIDFNGYEIIKILYESNKDVIVSEYTQKYFAWKFYPVNAYKPSNSKDLIFFNSRNHKLRSEEEKEETLWHELAHIADDLSLARFDHGDNKLNGKDDSAPVKFAKFMVGVKC